MHKDEEGTEDAVRKRNSISFHCNVTDSRGVASFNGSPTYFTQTQHVSSEPALLESAPSAAFPKTLSMSPTMKSSAYQWKRAQSEYSTRRSQRPSLSGDARLTRMPSSRHASFRQTESDEELGFYETVQAFIVSKVFTDFIFIIIMANTIILLAHTWDTVAVRAAWHFTILDTIFLAIYLMEMVLKLYVHRMSYFKDVWNVMDLVIVVVNIADFVLPLFNNGISGSGVSHVDAYRFVKFLKIFRAIRAVRVLRTIRFLTNLQVIIATCLQSIHSMGAIVGLMLLFMYMFAVFGRGLYANSAPERFGSIWLAFFTLFDILTLDDWFYIYEDVVTADPNSSHIIVYLIFYIIVENLIFLNLVVAVLVDNFQLALGNAHEQARQQKAQEATKAAAAIEASTAAADRSSSDIDEAAGEDESSCDFDFYRRHDSKRARNFGDYYADKETAQREVISRCFMLCAGLEYNSNLYEMQRHTFNLLVDTCSEHYQ